MATPPRRDGRVTVPTTSRRTAGGKRTRGDRYPLTAFDHRSDAHSRNPDLRRVELGIIGAGDRLDSPSGTDHASLAAPIRRQDHAVSPWRRNRDDPGGQVARRGSVVAERDSRSRLLPGASTSTRAAGTDDVPRGDLSLFPVLGVVERNRDRDARVGSQRIGEKPVELSVGLFPAHVVLVGRVERLRVGFQPVRRCSERVARSANVAHRRGEFLPRSVVPVTERG